jgi:Alpha/beta hydrolase domain
LAIRRAHASCGRQFVYDGFNQDEHRRQVFDGIFAAAAGAGRGSFNHRFARPGVAGNSVRTYFWPVDIFPFADVPQTDPVSGRTEGLLTKAERDGVVPKIFYALTSTEYWARAGSLVTTSLDAGRDLPLAANTRVYHIAGTPHAGSPFPPVRSGTRLWGNFAAPWPVMRALLLAMQEWLAEGKEPPLSRHPRIADGQLVPVARAGFPGIPGTPFPEAVPTIYRMEFGPRFLAEGIISHQPPKLGQPLPLLVPAVDADGNERAGIRLPFLAVPLGTYTGWNYQDPPPGHLQPLAGLVGAYVPFPRTGAERRLTHDPRLSVEERYAGRDAYLARIAAAARDLVGQRYLLERDVRWVLEAGARHWDDTAGSGTPDRGQ